MKPFLYSIQQLFYQAMNEPAFVEKVSLKTDNLDDVLLMLVSVVLFLIGIVALITKEDFNFLN